MRFETLLNRKTEGGASERDHLLEAARRGSESAQEALEGPEPPETMLYLMEWAYALCGRSGASMEGLAPVSYGTIEAWSRLMGVTPDPLEVRALITLDSVIRHPERGEQEKEAEAPKKPETPWPESKG